MISNNAMRRDSTKPRIDEPADLVCVNLDAPGELRYWLSYFGTSETKLHEAVSLMGGEVTRVRAYLRRFR